MMNGKAPKSSRAFPERQGRRAFPSFSASSNSHFSSFSELFRSSNAPLQNNSAPPSPLASSTAAKSASTRAASARLQVKPLAYIEKSNPVNTDVKHVVSIGGTLPRKALVNGTIDRDHHAQLQHMLSKSQPNLNQIDLVSSRLRSSIILIKQCKERKMKQARTLPGHQEWQ